MCIIFYSFIFFSGLYKVTSNIALINDKLAKGDYNLDDITFNSKCPGESDANVTYFIEQSANCGEEKGNSISSIKDSGRVFTLVNDRFCGSLVEKRYPLVKSYSDLDIEKMEKSKLCQKFIVNSDLPI